jgi:hypothetical protein
MQCFVMAQAAADRQGAQTGKIAGIPTHSSKDSTFSVHVNQL